jgi:hypothetical protein
MTAAQAQRYSPAARVALYLGGLVAVAGASREARALTIFDGCSTALVVKYSTLNTVTCWYPQHYLPQSYGPLCSYLAIAGPATACSADMSRCCSHSGLLSY